GGQHGRRGPGRRSPCCGRRDDRSGDRGEVPGNREPNGAGTTGTSHTTARPSRRPKLVGGVSSRGSRGFPEFSSGWIPMAHVREDVIMVPRDFLPRPIVRVDERELGPCL